MTFRTEQVEEYTVKELTIGQVLGLQDTGTSNSDRTLAMLGASVYKDGKPLGPDAKNLPARLAKKLTKLVTSLNNLDEEDEDDPKG